MQQSNPVKKVVIAGGGTAGWAVAAGLSQQLGQLIDIELIESDDVGTVGVGEATIPPMRSYHRIAGIDEKEFVEATSATFKMGILFRGWRGLGKDYMHSFGEVGKSTTWLTNFHHIWMEARERGIAGPLDSYCLEAAASWKHKFAFSERGGPNFAYHLDAGRYAKLLRKKCEARGVVRREGMIKQVELDPENGFIRRLHLKDGGQVNGDFFIDCTGFRGLLIEDALSTGYDDWSHWLPTNRALAVQTKAVEDPVPYTVSTTRTAGWQWKIPLQHRVGNGLVYCSDYMDDETAREELLSNIQGEMITEPRPIRYTTGARKKQWSKNCLALGLASGFLEPLESTSIYLVMIGISRFMRMFPFDGVSDAAVEQFNAVSRLELERIRDFIILHYKVTHRDDTPFWNDRKKQPIPDSLAHRIELFEETGQIQQAEADLFQVSSWLQVMMGQGIKPKSHHKFARSMSDDKLRGMLNDLETNIARVVESMPSHKDFIDRYCAGGVK